HFDVLLVSTDRVELVGAVAVPDVALLVAVTDLVEAEEQAAVVRVQAARSVGHERRSRQVEQMMIDLESRLTRGRRGIVERRVHVSQNRAIAVLQFEVFARRVLPGVIAGRRGGSLCDTCEANECNHTQPEPTSHCCVSRSVFDQSPLTNLFGLPSSGPPAGGFQSTARSIRLASAKSRSVIPPAECVLSLTQTLPQVTVRSG